MRLMIIDDEKPIRQWFSFIMGKLEGVEIVGDYSNGKVALEAMKDVQPDVVFTDIRMPVMDGIELIRQVKGTYPETDVVILSNFDDFEYVYQGLKLGAEDYLLKAQADDEKIVEVLLRLKEKLESRKIPEKNVNIENSSEVVEKMVAYIESEYQGCVKLSEIAKKLNYNSDYLSQIFKKCKGKNFNTYLIEIRMEKAKKLLAEGNPKIREVADAVGYSNEMYFSTAFKGYTGISPKKYMVLSKGN